MIESRLNLPQIADGEDKSSVLANRIRKNYRHLRKWAKRTETNAFRIYDKEIRQYPIAIDFYDNHYCIHYFSKGRDDDEPPPALVEEVENALKTVFGDIANSVFWRTRAKTKATRQYEKAGEQQQYITILEYGVKFKVNLTDYLDTGLFLDHRETRQMAAGMSNGKRVLNLFAYTCSFSVHAAVAGAVMTKSVDMSNTYTAWGRDNFILNGVGEKNHPIVRADCLKFLDDEISKGEKYDLIIIDPPTISRSKKMESLFDIHVDYINLVSKALSLLDVDGNILFSTNSRKFTFDVSHFPKAEITEVSKKTLPSDFHDPKIHRCWVIKKRR